MKCAVTGGYGFIGSNFVKYLYDNTDVDIVVIDKLTYAGSLKNISTKIQKSSRCCSVHADIATFDGSDPSSAVTTIIRNCDYVFHFAAESHVDNSISGPGVFVDTNVKGTFNLLEAARDNDVTFVHISTDEVYGDLDARDPGFREDMSLNPSSVYSATKAASDLLVKSYNTTYGMPYVITRCTNNYGPRQHVEKLLPKVITNALNDNPIPIYGDGLNVREWIHVDDHCSAIWSVKDQVVNTESVGNVWNIGSGVELANIELVKTILDIADKPHSLMHHVEDRKGHDYRYAMNSDAVRRLTDWKPKYDQENFIKGLEHTVEWYKANR